MPIPSLPLLARTHPLTYKLILYNILNSIKTFSESSKPDEVSLFSLNSAIVPPRLLLLLLPMLGSLGNVPGRLRFGAGREMLVTWQ